MAKLEPLGIKRLEGIHYYVHDLERSRRFYCEKLDFAETWRVVARARAGGPPALGRASRPATSHVVCSQPLGEGGRACALPAQAPRRRGHARCSRSRTSSARSVCSRSAAARPSTTSRRFEDDGGTLRQFSITTPFGDMHLPLPRAARLPRPVSRAPSPTPAAGGRNRFGFERDRPRHLELPDHEAGAALAGARARLRAILGGRVPHQRRATPERRDRLGPASRS